MKKLLNILYVTKPETFLALENEAVVVKENNEILMRVPLLNIEGIVHFGYTIGCSPALIAECVARNILITFVTENGKYLGSIIGESKGNVTLRKEQYRISDNEDRSCLYARNFIFGKLHNSKWILERATRDYELRVNVEISYYILCLSIKSLSARRAWIEIQKQAKEYYLLRSRSPQGGRGLKFLLFFILICFMTSLSARRAWIEIPWKLVITLIGYCRSPQGGRGLK